VHRIPQNTTEISTTGTTPPMILADSEKFDGTNWALWKDNILMIAELKGTTGYLDGSIKNLTTTIQSPKPTAPLLTTLPQSETPWNSPNLSTAEWKARNMWMKMLLIFNTKGPTGLGINTSGSVAEV